ncbi:MAG TPA: type II secretion system major pseudopilin GspG [Anaerohalosphaeraceae bacterium]|nr:type II secretion system major pseudopilin GspG [Anaerohalosphaeraceae bacterium]
MRKSRKGFTIIELLAVATIIALLAVFVVPRAFKGLGKAKRDIAKGKIAIVEGALARFEYSCGRLPADTEGLEALLIPPSDVQDRWDGPYLKKSDLLDPWDRPYFYLQQGTVNMNSYDIFSYGADGQPGGEGDNADIYND